MLDPRQTVKAGGIVPMDVAIPADQRTGVLRARRYEHPALAGRVVVRLSADDVAAASDIEMETLGYDEPQVSDPLGRQRFRALGFPGWALVNDPPHARFALEVMREFKQAARTAKSKPGHGRDAFSEIAKKLSRSVPHFLPSFWEEAGRVFLAEESNTFAAQCFEKAREAEDAHGLKVDEDLRSGVYLEFALGGALAGKSITGYGGDLEKAYGAKAAYPRFLELAVRRMLGGMPPWGGMAKDLRGLAKRAGLDPNEEDERLLLETLDGKGLSRAPAEFWTTYRPSIERLAAKNAAVRTRLRWLFPATGSYNNPFAEDWLPFLESTGALRGVTELGTDEAALEPPGSVAAWIQRLVGYAPRAEKTLAFIDAAAKRLIAEGVPVQLAGKNGWWGLELDPVERLLALGVPVADPTQKAFNLQNVTPRLDPVHIAAHPVLGPLLCASVGQLMGQPAFESYSRGKKGFAAARRAWVVEQIESARHGGVRALGEAIEKLQKATSPETFADFPEVHALLGTLDIASATARTLRGGLLAEFTWPAFEAAARELGGNPTVRSLFPVVLLSNATKVIALQKERIAEHDLVVPAGCMVQWLAFAGGQFVVSYWDRATSKQRGYWSGNVHEPFDVDGDVGPMRYGDVTSIQLADGAVSFGQAAVRPGDTRVESRARLATDGTTCWEPHWEVGAFKLREIDPATGRAGRFSWPAFVERETTREDGLHVINVTLDKLPVGTEHSPLGAKDGLSGFVLRLSSRHGVHDGEVVGVDGRRVTARLGSRNASAIVRMPGSEADLLISAAHEWSGSGHVPVVALHDREGHTTAKFGSLHPESSGWPVVPPLVAWHYLETRDLEASRALRVLDDALVARWVAGAADSDVSKLAAQSANDLPALAKSPVLRDAVASVVHRGAELVKRLETLRTTSDPALAVPHADDSAAHLGAKAFTKAFCAVLPGVHYDHRVDSEFDAVVAWFADQGAREFAPSGTAWPDLLGFERFVALRCFAPDVSDADRALILGFLRRLAGSVLVEDGVTIRTFRAQIEKDSPFTALNIRVRTQPGVFCTTNGASRYFVRVHPAYGPTLTIEVVEYTSDGVFRDPSGATVSSIRTIERRGVREWIEAFLARASSSTAWSWPAEGAVRLAEATGLNSAEAAIVWGISPYSMATQWGRIEPPNAGVREVLGLKAQEAKLAIESLSKMSRASLMAVYERAATDDPAGLFAPMEPDARNESVLGRMITAWNAIVGQRVALRDDVVALVDKELKPAVPAPALVRALLEPGTSPLFTVKTRTHASAFVWRGGGKIEDMITGKTLGAIATLIPFLFTELPVGDEYRARLPAFHARALQALADPELMLPLSARWADEKDRAANRALYEGIGGVDVEVDAQNAAKVTGRDNGLFVAVILQDASTLQVSFRPSRVRDWNNERLLWTLADSATGHFDRASDAAAFLASRGCREIIDRITNTPVPAGRYEADPRASCPDLVARVQKAHGLDENAATLYLQTLVLAEPTKSAVQTWNAWKPAEYKRAVEALVAKKLVVEGKRERAGREIFLQGEWLKAESPNLPWESWKQNLYALEHGALPRHVAPAPLHALFEAAWKRVEAGDIPRLEEV